MKFEVKVPAVGESITEALIGKWMKENGDYVKRDEPLFLLETDKASVEVVAEQSGIIEIKVPAGKTIPIGSVVANIDTEAVAQTTATAKVVSPAQNKPSQSVELTQSSQPSQDFSDFKLSPAVQKMITEKQIDPSKITGTGKGGRITKEDLLIAVAAKEEIVEKPEVFKTPSPSTPRSGDVKIVPMTSIRKRIAEKLVQSQHTTATLTTFNEIDMSQLLDLRSKYKDLYKEKYGVNLGFMGFFVKASIEALKSIPEVNASIEGTNIVYHNYYNMGVAVGTERGLIVPVLKNADKMSIAQIELSIKNYAQKAKDGKITIDDLSGGTFTISNGGVYGSLMSTPILNPPQSGILGMHKIEERAVVVNKQIVIRPMMYVALSYDHRMIDGKEAVTFLVRVKECIEEPSRLLLEV